MKSHYSILIAFFLSLNIFAQDTFSIIAVDPVTGEIGSAGASCVDGAASFGGLLEVITEIVPGRGGANSQAFVCIPNINLTNAIQQLEAGLSPEEVVDWLLVNDACASGNFNPQLRQYGVVDFDPDGNPRVAGFTGSMNNDFAGDMQGANYTVQGNILLNETVLINMEDNFVNTEGTLGDKLMAALQGANFAGADMRCLARGTSSTTAYLVVYRSDDDPEEPFIELNIEEMPFGEEPIDSLQVLYDNFLLSVNDISLNDQIRLFPNPVSKELIISYQNPSIQLRQLEIYDINGKKVIEKSKFNNTLDREERIDVSTLQSGIYFLNIKDANKIRASLKFIKR